MRPYADEGATFFQELLQLGFVRPVAGESYFVTETARFHDRFAVAAVAAAGAGNDLDVDVTAAYTDNAKVYARVGDLVFKPGATPVYAKIVDKSESGGTVTLTLRPLSSSVNLGAQLDDDVWVIYSSSFPEGTGQPEAATPKTVKYEMFTQIVKETVAATGTVLTDQVWFEVTEDGKPTPSYFSLAQLAGEFRQYLKIDGALMIGQENDNLEENTTKGMINVALDSDGNLGSDVLDIDGFYAIDAYLRKVHAPDMICGYLAAGKYNEFQSQMQTLLSNTNINNAIRKINHDMYGLGADEKFEVLHDYQALSLSGRTFKISNLRSLDQPNIYNTGVSGEAFQDYAIFIPGNKTTDGENKLASYFGMRHKQLGAYNRMLEVWPDGAGHPGMKIGDLDQSLLYYRSHVGFEYRKTQQWAMVTG